VWYLKIKMAESVSELKTAMGKAWTFEMSGDIGLLYIYVVPEMAENVAELRGEAMVEAGKTC